MGPLTIFRRVPFFCRCCIAHIPSLTAATPSTCTLLRLGAPKQILYPEYPSVLAVVIIQLEIH